MQITSNIWTTGPVRSLITNGFDLITRNEAIALIKARNAGLCGIIAEPDNGMPYLVSVDRFDVACVARFQATDEDVMRLLDVTPTFDEDFNLNYLNPSILSE